jgi:hypothetical protein
VWGALNLRIERAPPWRAQVRLKHLFKSIRFGAKPEGAVICVENLIAAVREREIERAQFRYFHQGE